MNAVVVDTDIVSFLFKGHPAASLYKSDLTGKALIVSFMTLAELDRWSNAGTSRDHPERRLGAILSDLARQHQASQVIHSNA